MGAALGGGGGLCICNQGSNECRHDGSTKDMCASLFGMDVVSSLLSSSGYVAANSHPECFEQSKHHKLQRMNMPDRLIAIGEISGENHRFGGGLWMNPDLALLQEDASNFQIVAHCVSAQGCKAPLPQLSTEEVDA
jgi:hypothetical protein